ncbi:diacylglycerol kinase [Acidovorax lacteus]|uniref:Diacylglycerol kinase n=1 Tax=Acidovorax lacteus TaxID=1924988 RepID=A0ABP8L376_9BURK
MPPPSSDRQDQPTPTGTAFDNPHKRRTGLSRLWHATGHSLQGLRAGWTEKAFRQEVLLATVMVPLAFVIGQTWVEVSVLCAVLALVLITELLNSAIEAAIDRIGPEWHELSGRAKDLGSAAVLLSLLLCGAVWGAAIYQRLTHG